jgi:8-oxo-dGTP diphosphatase
MPRHGLEEMAGRQYPDRPVIGVGAIVLDGNRVLLVKRAHEPLKGQWSVPGGVVEIGELLEHAVAREVREETSLEISVGPVVEVLERIRRDPDERVEFHYVLVDYLCTPTGGVLTPGSDAEAARWIAIEDLDRYGVAEKTIEVIRKAEASLVSTENKQAPPEAR